MDLDTALDKRRSIRSFKNKKVSFKYILDAVEAATKGPFAGNSNHIKFVIIEDPKTIERLAQLASQSWITEAQTLVVACSDERDLENLYGERGRVYSRQQAGAAIENFILKLTDLGLASCWVGSYSDELIKNLLKIPDYIQIDAIIPIGYADEKPKVPKKRSIETSIFWERWFNEKRPTFFPEPEIIGANPANVV